jgi:acyl-CoA synthetase (AMP-forming)/AMP-acid ligase II
MRLKNTKPDVEITCVYGSTEAEPIAHLDATQIAPDDLAAMHAGRGLLVGNPVSDIKLRITQDEIQVAGAHVNGGYLDPAHDAENKIAEGDVIWHRTGDAGRLDDQGRLWLLGRIGSQVAMRDGPLFPFAVEVAARAWDGVTQCALIEAAGAPCLAIQGNARYLPIWHENAAKIGISKVVIVPQIPMDRRHASKIDRVALAKRMPR